LATNSDHPEAGEQDGLDNSCHYELPTPAFILPHPFILIDQALILDFVCLLKVKRIEID
jgi:hypothetical protein